MKQVHLKLGKINRRKKKKDWRFAFRQAYGVSHCAEVHCYTGFGSFMRFVDIRRENEALTGVRVIFASAIREQKNFFHSSRIYQTEKDGCSQNRCFSKQLLPDMLSIYFQYTQYIFYPFISAQLGLPPARTHWKRDSDLWFWAGDRLYLCKILWWYWTERTPGVIDGASQGEVMQVSVVLSKPWNTTI